MVKVEVGKNEVVFKLEGAQKFLAVKSSVRIPFEKIASVSTEKVKPLWLAGRVGTHLPGVSWLELSGQSRGKHSITQETDRNVSR